MYRPYHEKKTMLANLADVKQDLSSVYKYCGSVPTVDDLPDTENQPGDVYNVEETDMNYAYVRYDEVQQKHIWDPLGPSLQGYLTKTEAEETYSTIEMVNDHIEDTTNPHHVTKAQVGLGNVDNTSDMDKPVSTATQTAISSAVNALDSSITSTDGTNVQVKVTETDGKLSAVSITTDNTASKADATLVPIYSRTPTFSEWEYSGLPEGVSVGNLFYDSSNWWLYLSSGYSFDVSSPESATKLIFDVSSVYSTTITATRTRTDIIGYTLGSQDDKPVAAAEPLLFAQYYPEGNVKSAAEFTEGIKYNFDTTNHTATVKPFCNTGNSANDNSSLVGRVVIPPFVDAQDNGYISDDGTRYKVVGVGSGTDSNNSNENLTAVIAPSTVAKIEDKAFRRCTKLASVSTTAATSIGSGAFNTCTSLASVSLPAVDSIGTYAFNSCTKLASVSIPAATKIQNYAFYSCTKLTSVSIPAAKSIGGHVFDGCTKLASVSLPAATSVGGSAFNNCNSLASVSLPVVTSIDGYSFAGCTSLTSVDFGETLSSAPTLGSNAFSSVPTSCKIIVPDAQYDAWIAASGWSSLVTQGYKFLKHSEWEYARKYEVDGKLNKMEAIAWSSLKAKRDAGQLVPGASYRITDYVATTNGDMESHSANHPFDIIVTADDERTLNEHARAVIHEGDLPDDIVDGSTRTKYFAGCDLAAWKVWYCLDNDTNRFAWADTTNGKGVVYRLIDEFGNDCPYDFKGIQFQRWSVTNITSPRMDSDSLTALKNALVYGNNVGHFSFVPYNLDDEGSTALIVNSESSAFYFTFSDNGTDASLSSSKRVYGNRIGAFITSTGKLRLNNIVFLSGNSFLNTFDNNCTNFTLGGYCNNNNFGTECSQNILALAQQKHTFGTDCYLNIIGDGCSSIVMSSNCSCNVLSASCQLISFGAACRDNVLGQVCRNISFGIECHENSLGNRCLYDSFGNYCQYNTFGLGNATKSSYCYVIVENGVMYVDLNCTSGSLGPNAPYKNVKVSQGVRGTGSQRKLIEDQNNNQSYQTVYQTTGSNVISV